MTERTSNRVNRSGCDLSGPLLVGLLAGDETAVRRTLCEGHGRFGDVASMAHEVVGPALREVGEMWRRGEINIAEEHLATALVSRALAHLSASIPLPVPGAPRILFTCLEGEYHDLGLRILTDVAREAGWDSENLGANVPRKAMVDFIAVRRPEALGLSICLAGHVAEAVKTIEEVRQVAPETRILVGGRAVAVDPALADLLPADVIAPSVLTLRDWLRMGGPKAGMPGARPLSVVGSLPATMPDALRVRLGGRVSRPN